MTRNEPMKDYLWDRSGEPDPEIDRLEFLLGQFRLQSPELEWDRLPRLIQSERGSFEWASFVKRMWLPAAAALALVALVGFALTIRARFDWRPGEAWRVVALSGSPQIAGSIAKGARLPVGGTLVTDEASRARLRVAGVGVIDVEPNSRLRLVATDTKRHRLALDYGTIEAHMWAPPFTLGVETPSAALFDLGCAFTLHIEPNGYGTVKVTSGWVDFKTPSKSTLVPTGAEAATRPRLGPGTAYFSDAAPEFKSAIAAFDSNPEESVVRTHALDTILATARARDAFTLLSLLKQIPREQRAPVADRLAAFMPIPAGYTREDIIDLRMDAMDEYWNQLHLSSPKSWIMNWKDVVLY
jgi:hypothetical protein